MGLKQEAAVPLPSIAEYEAKYKSAKVQSERLPEIQRICTHIMIAQPRYAEVESATGVPWRIVAGIHRRESSGKWSTYLQNGDPLFNSDGNPVPTVHVPRGVGPFNPQNWQNSAIAALGGNGAHKSAPRDLGYWLRWCEMYNGCGYLNRGLPSPYLWSFTDQYDHGQFDYDGHFNPTKVDQNAGVAAILKVLGVEDLMSA